MLDDRGVTVAEARDSGWGVEAEAFVAWMKKVDRAILRRVGVSIHDLPDQDFASAFEEGADPDEFALEVLEEEGWDGDE